MGALEDKSEAYHVNPQHHFTTRMRWPASMSSSANHILTEVPLAPTKQLVICQKIDALNGRKQPIADFHDLKSFAHSISYKWELYVP
jgi:hypothetical protein